MSIDFLSPLFSSTFLSVGPVYRKALEFVQGALAWPLHQNLHMSAKCRSVTIARFRHIKSLPEDR